jgi:hypothetical protein
MNSIGENLKEKTKKKLGYASEPVSKSRMLIDRLKELCLINNIPMRLNGHFVSAIRIGIYRGSAGVDSEGRYNDSEYIWARPVIKQGRLYLSFKSDQNYFVDAAEVDCFGQAIHKLV